MNASLGRLLAQRGEISFPHAPATAEELLTLFRVNASADLTTRTLADLVRADPGLAFNLCRLLTQAEISVARRRRIDLNECIARFNPHKAVAILAPKETVREVFSGNRPLEAAYCGIAAAAADAAAAVLVDPMIDEGDRDLAALLALGSAFGLLALANMAPDASLEVLNSPTGDACKRQFGFTTDELAEALGERYRVPLLNDPVYPDAIRIAVSATICAGLRSSWDARARKLR